MAVINGVPFVQSLFVWGTDTSTSEAPSPVVSLCDLAVMYVIGFWLNKNLKLHTYCVPAKPALGAIGAGPARLSWLPTFGIPPLVPSKLLKEKDNRIRSGSLGSSIDCHIQEAAKKKKRKQQQQLAPWVGGGVVRWARPLPCVRKDGTLAVLRWQEWVARDKSSAFKTTLGDPDTVPSVTLPPVPSGYAYAHHRDADNTGCD